MITKDLTVVGLVRFTAQTRMSGIDLPPDGDGHPGRSIRKGAADSVRAWVTARGYQVIESRPGDDAFGDAQAIAPGAGMGEVSGYLADSALRWRMLPALRGITTGGWRKARYLVYFAAQMRQIHVTAP
ncbi:hypothetical protein [Trebonia kvetii]|uniref:hypothetical protein n=1 Tax=Trebonia kvetii TaxID=2480626 RepID=UPI003F6DAC16